MADGRNRVVPNPSNGKNAGATLCWGKGLVRRLEGGDSVIRWPSRSRTITVGVQCSASTHVHHGRPKLQSHGFPLEAELAKQAIRRERESAA